MLPFILKRLGFDPASASAPFVATLVDVWFGDLLHDSPGIFEGNASLSVRASYFEGPLQGAEVRLWHLSELEPAGTNVR
jgi:hypothetical protein